MRKEDEIRLHALLFQMRRVVEATWITEGTNYFDSYDKLGVVPTSLHRDKRAHEMAIFLLGEGLSKAAVECVGVEANLKNMLHFIHQPQRQTV